MAEFTTGDLEYIRDRPHGFWIPTQLATELLDARIKLADVDALCQHWETEDGDALISEMGDLLRSALDGTSKWVEPEPESESETTEAKFEAAKAVLRVREQELLDLLRVVADQVLNVSYGPSSTQVSAMNADSDG